jgi:hypothetical protein
MAAQFCQMNRPPDSRQKAELTSSNQRSRAAYRLQIQRESKARSFPADDGRGVSTIADVALFGGAVLA